MVEAELHGALPIVESPAVVRSPYDREILRLALPALGALAAEPLYIPIALLALDQGWGILGVWCGLAALIVVRLATCGGRFVSEHWVLTGAQRA
jgi:hypothetical protein